MATLATNSKIIVSEYALTGYNNTFSLAITGPAHDVTAFQDTGMKFISGTPSAAFSHSGYHVGAAVGEQERELYDALGSTSTVYPMLMLGTNATLIPAYVIGTTWSSQLTMEAPVDGVMTAGGEWGSNNQIYRGLVLSDSSISATGTTTAIDFGAAGSAGGDGFLFISSITGTATNATIDIESATSSGGSYSSEGTFTFSAVGVQTLAMSGTVNQFIRINTTSLGGATSFNVIAVACVDGVTQ